MNRKRRRVPQGSEKTPDPLPNSLRIIGGRFRGRPIRYHGDPRTRPMKQRVREAAFNLIGPRVAETHVIDLFAGTGALAWEALSRGAASALLIERHFPTARVIRENAESLGLSDRIQLVSGDTFVWSRKLDVTAADLSLSLPWLVFCSPPYELYESRRDDMLSLLQRMVAVAPVNSLIIVESDRRFETGCLPSDYSWDVRTYSPAVLSVGERAG